MYWDYRNLLVRNLRVATRMRSRKSSRGSQRGFTLIETLIIVIVVGVLATIALPSLTSMMDGAKVNQAISEVRSTLQEGQRQAIRNNEPCMVSVSLSDGKGNNGNGNGNKGNGNGNANGSGNGNSDNTNGNENGHDDNKGQGSSPSPGQGSSPSSNPLTVTKQCPTSSEPDIAPNVGLESNMKTSSSSKDVAIAFGVYGSAEFGVVGDSPAQDSSGKIVAFIPEKTVKKKCLAISSTLGLTRVGNYSGGVTPEQITKEGVCTALDWTKQ